MIGRRGEGEKGRRGEGEKEIVETKNTHLLKLRWNQEPGRGLKKSSVDFLRSQPAGEDQKQGTETSNRP